MKKLLMSYFHIFLRAKKKKEKINLIPFFFGQF